MWTLWKDDKGPWLPVRISGMEENVLSVAIWRRVLLQSDREKFSRYFPSECRTRTFVGKQSKMIFECGRLVKDVLAVYENEGPLNLSGLD